MVAAMATRASLRMAGTLANARRCHNPPRMSDTTTRGVRIEVESTFEPDRSSPAESEYLFSYTVRISNVGDEVVQLLARHWVITNANGEVEHVRGPGVVGEQPVLRPGQS